MSAPQRIRKRVENRVLEGLDAGVSLASLRDDVLALIALHGEEAQVQADGRGTCGDCDNDDLEVNVVSYVWVERDETPKEVASREAQAERSRQSTERYERKQLAELLAKYPDAAAVKP